MNARCAAASTTFVVCIWVIGFVVAILTPEFIRMWLVGWIPPRIAGKLMWASFVFAGVVGLWGVRKLYQICAINGGAK